MIAVKKIFFLNYRVGLKKLSNMANDSALIDAENAVMTTFDFLNSGSVVEDDDDLR